MQLATRGNLVSFLLDYVYVANWNVAMLRTNKFQAKTIHLYINTLKTLY